MQNRKVVPALSCKMQSEINNNFIHSNSVNL
jgi:hypothetical protein